MSGARLLLAGLAAALVLLPVGGAGAQDKPLTTPQERMKTCNAEASKKGLLDGPRKEFMSACLRGENTRALTSQQLKMRSCNRQASEKNLKGDKRKGFIKECLSA